MQEVFNFILSHYEAILSVLTLILSVVVFILRKKPVTDIYGVILSWLPKFINLVEEPGNGASKKKMVIDSVNAALKLAFPDINVKSYEQFISNAIEDILNTPQKKED